LAGEEKKTAISRYYQGMWLRNFVLCAVVAMSAAAASIPSPAVDVPASKEKQAAVFSGGCFWGVDAVFKHVKGVTKVVSGYAGGEAKTASYDIVSTGQTGHAESVQVTYDPSVVTYGTLLKVFFGVAHDPTQLNYQGPDHGTQYRSAIFYSSEDQKKAAEAYIAQLNQAHVYRKPIVTQVVPLKGFYPAESYHQNYLALHPDQPYIVYNDMPKLAALKKELPELAK
jgi:peptide-methionine (S)-S-oxide reductase